VRLKGLLKFFMQSRQIRAMKGRLNTISVRKNSQDSLLLADPSSLPGERTLVEVLAAAVNRKGKRC
jgi:hypothetical protein